jgi:hypothetical protein
MRFKLADDAKARVRYSPAEKEIFAMIPRAPRRVSSRDIVERRYGAEAPYHAVSVVGGTLRSLARKAVHNDEPFRVQRSQRAGPHPIEFWLERA